MDELERTRLSFREHWRGSGFYERFETSLSIGLVVLTCGIAIVTFARLIYTFVLQVPANWTALDLAKIHSLFALVLTIVIALEFSRSIVESLTNRHFIIASQSVVLIGILTVVRKLMLIDIREVAPLTLLGLAAIVAALGVLYYFLGNRALGGRLTGKRRRAAHQGRDSTGTEAEGA